MTTLICNSCAFASDAFPADAYAPQKQQKQAEQNNRISASLSDCTSLFQKDASTRAYFFKIFAMQLDTKLFQNQEHLNRHCYTLYNNSISRSLKEASFQNNFIHKQNYQLIRPLLYLSRIDISLICKQLRIPVYPDKSNQSIKYSRNRIRKQLLPSLKLFYNPQIEQALFRFAEFVSKEHYFIASLLNAIPHNYLYE